MPLRDDARISRQRLRVQWAARKTLMQIKHGFGRMLGHDAKCSARRADA